MTSTGHMSAPKGTKVIVHMRDGSKIVGKYFEKQSRYVAIEIDEHNSQLIPTAKIRTISIYKPNTKIGES